MVQTGCQGAGRRRELLYLFHPQFMLLKEQGHFNPHGPATADTCKNTFYQGLEPRFSLKYSLSERVSLKASYARMNQYLHLVSNSGASLPTDVWYPSTAGVSPQRSDQVAGGISLLLGKSFLLTNEVYYKWLYNQIDYYLREMQLFLLRQ